MDNSVRRLIEVDLPIGIISQHSLADQNKRKGHLHSLHVWWATRPLAACRAVLMATLLPDPADERCSEAFRQEARETLSWMSSRDLSDPVALRQALLDFIGHFADWNNSINPQFVATARQLVQAAHPEGRPLVVDPFAGIGSIPFEALRIGADAFAGDYNPVATLLLKTALEYLPTYGDGLTESLRIWGKKVREWTAEELGQFYPTEPDGSIPMAYLWARTIRCEGPSCGIEVPLAGLLWLSRRGKQMAALQYWGDASRSCVAFEIIKPGSDSEVQPPIVRRFVATCPVCGYTTPYKRVREQLRSKRGGTLDARMIAVALLKPDGGRAFRLATDKDVDVARQASETLHRLEAAPAGTVPLVPHEALPPDGTLGFRINKYGMVAWGDLFTPRQALTLSTFATAIARVYGERLDGSTDRGLAGAVATCLALALSKTATYSASTSFLHPTFGMQQVFLGSAMPMKPDFAEVNPLMPTLVGGFEYAVKQITDILEREAPASRPRGTVYRGSATLIPLPDQSVSHVVTDPPYYDAVPYAALSDFSYVWLKRAIGDLHPDIFQWEVTPKLDECIVDPGPAQPGHPTKNKVFFERTMQSALEECRRVLQPGGLAVVLFAHKGTAGWEALLNALVGAGWTVTASWPIETERATRWRAKGSAALASSVFLVCRPRDREAPVGEWRDVLSGLNERVAGWVPRLAQEGIHGADAIFSCLGPALQVYTQYQRVETAGGEVIPLGDVRNGRGQVEQRGYLSYVWEAVAREALKVIFPEADPTGFEEDARLTAMWLWTLRGKLNAATPGVEDEASGDEEGKADRKAPKGYTLPYDDARLIIQGLGAREERLRGPGGVLELEGDKARLLPVAERRRFLIGGDAPRTPSRARRRGLQLAFEEIGVDPEEGTAVEPARSTLDRVHQGMLLFGDGRSQALRRLLVDQGVGHDEQFWRLANALSALYPPASQEKRWVDGLLARRKGLGL